MNQYQEATSPEEFDPTQFAEMSKEDQDRMNNISSEERRLQAEIIRKKPQTRVFVQNNAKGEEIFNELFFPYNLSITKLLQSPKIYENGEPAEDTTGTFAHLPIEIDSSKHITAGDAILFCTTSPICVNRSESGNPFISGFLEKVNRETDDHMQASMNDELNDDEFFSYVEDMIIYSCYILQRWSNGSIELVFMKNFMEYPCLMMTVFKDLDNQISINVME